MLEHILKGGPMMVPLIALQPDQPGGGLRPLAWPSAKTARSTPARSAPRCSPTCARTTSPARSRECEAARGPIASVLLAGLRSYEHLQGKKESSETMRLVVGQVMEDYSAQAMSVVNKRLDVLTTIGTAAPLLGMTGTVTGMIASFAGLAEAGSVGGGGGAVANGISEAMVTTAAGLIIALAAVIPQSVFNRWSDEIELEIEEANSELVEFILTHH